MHFLWNTMQFYKNCRMLQLGTFVQYVFSSKFGKRENSVTFCTGVTSDASASANQQKMVRMASGSRETYTRTRVLRTIAGAQMCKSICNSDGWARWYPFYWHNVPYEHRIRCHLCTSNFYQTNSKQIQTIMCDQLAITVTAISIAYPR